MIDLVLMQHHEEKLDAIITMDFNVSTVQVHYLDFNEDRKRPSLIKDDYYALDSDGSRISQILSDLKEQGYRGPIKCEEIETPYTLRHRQGSTEIGLFFREQLVDVVAYTPAPFS